MARPRTSTAINLSNNPVQALPPISSEPLLTAHQQLTLGIDPKCSFITARLATCSSWIVRLEATNIVGYLLDFILFCKNKCV